jgi:hypothetical protein
MFKKRVRSCLVAGVILLAFWWFDMPLQILLLFATAAVVAVAALWNEHKPVESTTDERPE